MQRLWDEYNDVQTKLEMLNEAEAIDRDSFETAYFDLSAKMRDLLRASSATPTVAASLPGTSANNSGLSEPFSTIRLPKIDIPKFSGKYDEWFPFRDSFISIIHTNPTLRDINRLQYLRAALSGDAISVLSSLEISDANYEVAWNLLKRRYDDKRAIVHSHIGSILDLPVMTKENASELRQITDGANRHVQALTALKRPINAWDDPLVYIISSKLDTNTSREWESSLEDSELPTLKKLFDFLSHRCRVLEATSKSGTSSRSQPHGKQKVSCNGATNTNCEYCKAAHLIYRCPQFLALPIAKRIAEARTRKICLNCLRSTAHTANKCTSGGCKTCTRKHNTLLHLQTTGSEQAVSSGEKNNDKDTAAPAAPDAITAHTSSVSDGKSILLSTAVALVCAADRSQKPCRILLDSGSQVNLISRKCLNSLRLNPRSVSMSISGINGTATRSTEAVHVKLQSRLNSFSVTLDCIVTNRVTDSVPAFSMKKSAFNLPQNIELADPNFNVSSDIDILVGAEVFWTLLCVGQIKASLNHPTLQKTRFGWIMGGRMGTRVSQNQKAIVLHTTISNDELHNQLQRFWRIEDIPNNPNNYTSEEQDCERYFLETVTRDSQGRYVVKLPLKEGWAHSLGHSRGIALDRFRALERRLDRDPTLKALYSEFMEEYIALGHMELINEQSPNEQGVYYIPHHCVFKQTTEGPKIRVVFNASCKTDTGFSLNDLMLVGPVVQQDLASILLRFRIHKVVLVADITKMYRQVRLHPSQTRLHRIFWRKDNNSNIEVYEAMTVTYGTAAAAFVATNTIKHHAKQRAQQYPLGSLCVIRDFYVDDMLTGAETIEDALEIRDQTIQLLREASFELSKWGSNCPELLSGVSPRGDKIVSFQTDSDVRILGILWDQDGDFFRFSYQPSLVSGPVTKRLILSEVSRLFDPLGLLGPIIVIAKLVLQDLWQSGLDWDESVPQDTHTKWLQLKLQLPDIKQLQIPRCVKDCTHSQDFDLHGFCDASQRAYGACLYVRTKTGQHKYKSVLLCSKSRVAPLKAVSLPRLELSAALLLAQLIDKVKASFSISNANITLWSDSTISLNWISSPSRKWLPFVANRVGEIQRLTEPRQWRHVASSDNPADVLSRGMLPNELTQSHMWWNGPPFLQLPEQQWPNSEFVLLNEIPEQRKICAVAAPSYPNVIVDLLNKFSNINKICRIVAYCLRALTPQNKKSLTISVSPKEMTYSLNVICRVIQKQSFADEYDSLINHREIKKTSNLLCLSPFMDEDRLIRVGGRLKNSSLAFDARHQIVLPRHHDLSKRIIELEHVRNMHSGVQATMAAVRQRFWPLSLRSATRKMIASCVTCFRVKPISSEALMGSLPESRVTVSRPFTHCGVDYAGPIILREGKRRNSRNHKAYISVFVCFATKAVHLELVSDLTTDAFIAALKRLISRRGKPERIYSDNATNFVGAQKQIKEFYEFLKADSTRSPIEHFLHEQKTEWSFIPPNAPHFGGLWEAAVKSVKFHLARIIGSAHLTFEEMQTVLCEIEAILNSRPITPLSSDPNDMNYLSPGHFLVGAPLNSFPTSDLNDINVNKLLRWQIIEQMRQHFWRRWSQEYLNTLQQRNKWQTSKGQQLETGQLVIIKQQATAPLQWPIGRVQEIHIGSDGVARSATVKTNKGSYVRPLTKLAILPL
ncbi:uncharacterized protein LOC112466438 [Temnothorax curvispinosus]|uniref:Uncharacterized protein LOC112466438 n=1 Tax=Temnothorax curvispinosus TaxID=300111 RepID=A0A6J1R5K2_9HYME|nr:uncharacterized protein LOC112466438 [Temnothorax curvispinosus]